MVRKLGSIVVVVVADDAIVDVVAVVLFELFECLTGLPSSRLPIPIKASSSCSGGVPICDVGGIGTFTTSWTDLLRLFVVQRGLKLTSQSISMLEMALTRFDSAMYK